MSSSYDVQPLYGVEYSEPFYITIISKIINDIYYVVVGVALVLIAGLIIIYIKKKPKNAKGNNAKR